MDSYNSSAPPPYHHHPQPPPQTVLVTSQTQTHHHPFPNNSYPLNNNNSIFPTSSNVAMFQHQNPQFPFNSMPTASSKPLDNQYSDGPPSGGGGFSIEPARKQRGRPRKYLPDNGIGLGLSPVTPGTQNSSMVVHSDSGDSGAPLSDIPGKRRGRPPGLGKKQLDALGVPGVGFTPHVIIVKAGEDVASQIMDFLQQGPRTICILSANGAISNVTLRQAAMAGGAVTYEGRFDIISLSGSFMLLESNGNCSRMGALSVSLAGSDGRVSGGVVAGILKAATTVQVVVGSFIPVGKKSKSSGPSSAQPSDMYDFGAPAIRASPSPGDSSESAKENIDSPLNHGSGGHYSNSGQPIQNMPMYSNMDWAKLHENASELA